MHDSEVPATPESAAQTRASARKPTIWRPFLKVTHRWVGLASSLVLSIVGLTGAVLVWGSKNPLAKIIGAGPLHERLALGKPGYYLVVISTIAGLLLVLSGIFLWWKQKIFRIRNRPRWYLTVFDLHHCVGIFGLIIMLILTASGIGMVLTTPADGLIRVIVFRLHTALRFPIIIKLVYMVGSALFFVQALTGTVMWFKFRQARIRRESKN